MRLAFTVGAYRLVDFIHLGLKQLQKLSPDSPVLVFDDASPESHIIKKLAEEQGAAYKCSRVRRGHFANDFAAIINSLAFAEAAGADVAVKVSQRFIFRLPESIAAIEKAFSNPNICVATPGQPKHVNGSNKATAGFGAFTTLSDVVMIRVGCISPAELLQMYRERIVREVTPYKDFIEIAVDELHHTRFPGRTVKIPELTDPTSDPIYLRRYQSNEYEYRALAATHGLNGRYLCHEWQSLEKENYLCKPLCV